MTISVWRYSHLTLAVSSFLFIFLAAITGIILAFEPISNKVQPFKVANFKEITLSETLSSLESNFDEIIDLQVDANGFVLIDALTKEGENVNGYINPNSGAYLGKPIQKGKFFQVITNFHRSMFLKSIGRIFVGITSFLLFLIAVSGSILIIKRQRSFKRIFSKIVNESFSQYWHIILGRLSLIPIILITITGVYLSLLRFDVLPQESVNHNIDFETIKNVPEVSAAQFPALKGIMLHEVRSVEFPFSPDVEDYYTISLKNRELLVNQVTGELLSEINHPLIDLFTNLSVVLHTGQGSILWSVILAIACINILFFIYSGFAITFKRGSVKIKNKYSTHDAKVIILVGSENGSTFRLAKAFHDQLLKKNVKSYIDELNNYTTYNKAQDLVIITATYGQGEAPANANNFMNKLEVIEQTNKINYAVVGFGSLAYPDFCKYGFEVDKALDNHSRFSQLFEITTINDRSFEAYDNWMQQWADIHQLELNLEKERLITKPTKVKSFKVVEKTEPNDTDDTFLISVKPKYKLKYTSGDLLAIYPKNDYRERLYSIGKVNGNMHLSVKLHEFGIGSNFLNDQVLNNAISAKIIRNSSFYFPKKANRVLMIANGTGIAPFLGMIDENKLGVETHLYWGGRTQNSLKVYLPQLEKGLESKQLSDLKIAYSQEDRKEYVQDILNRDNILVAKTLQEHGIIMICGSLTMQKDVLSILEHISVEFNKTLLSHYINNNQIKMDCY